MALKSDLEFPGVHLWILGRSASRLTETDCVGFAVAAAGTDHDDGVEPGWEVVR